MVHRSFLLSLMVFYLVNQTVGQNQLLLDSLRKNVTLAKTIDERLAAYQQLARTIKGSSPDSAIAITERALKLARSTGNDIKIARVKLEKASFILWKEKTAESLKLVNECIVVFQKNKQAVDLAWCYYHLGKINRSVTKIESAISNLLKALQMFEELNNLDGQASCFGLLSQIYSTNQKDLSKARAYAEKELEIYQKQKNDKQIAHALTDLGMIYTDLKLFSKAEECYKKSAEYKKKVGDILGVGINLNNLASSYSSNNKHSIAVAPLQEALAIFEAAKSDYWISIVSVNLAEVYLKTNKLVDAEKAALRTIEIGKRIGFKEVEQVAYSTLSDIEATKGDFKKSLESYKNYSALKDSVLNETNLKQIEEANAKYNTEKKDREIKLLNKDKALHKAIIANKELEVQKSKTQKFLLFGGIGLMLLFVWFVYSRLRISNKQKALIENQKHIVEAKQKEILDSIAYAKYLQEAILPSTSIWQEHAPESFVLYKPKDIVAGDFYWVEKLGDTVYFAVADCTGHGVPGAMVSVVCSNALYRAVREFNLTETGSILDKTRDLVIETFQKSSSEVKDGMDISLLSYNEKSNKITWSGANNALWYVLPNKSEVQEIKADKQPIGKTAHPKPFTTHTIEYQKGTLFYLYTDGFADQFGGGKAKKFKAKNLLNFLGSKAHMPVQQQLSQLSDTFETWRGDLEQLDDLCIIGIRI